MRQNFVYVPYANGKPNSRTECFSFLSTKKKKYSHKIELDEFVMRFRNENLKQLATFGNSEKFDVRTYCVKPKNGHLQKKKTVLFMQKGRRKNTRKICGRLFETATQQLVSEIRFYADFNAFSRFDIQKWNSHHACQLAFRTAGNPLSFEHFSRLFVFSHHFKCSSHARRECSRGGFSLLFGPAATLKFSLAHRR